MGGEVLELLNDRAQRLEREAHEKGLKLGIEQGLEQGREQGIEQGLEQGKKEGSSQAVRELSERLAALGVSQETIDLAIASMRDQDKEDAS